MTGTETPAPGDSGPFRIGQWRVIPDRNVIVRGDTERRLENRVMQTLVFLARNPGRVVRRDEFFETVWQGLVVNEEALSRVISLLRSALGDKASRPKYIQTVPGVGYRLIAEVGPVAAEGARPGWLEQASGGSPAGPSRGRRPVPTALTIIALLAVGAWALYRIFEVPPAAPPPGRSAATTQAGEGPAIDAEQLSLAVLPFVDLGPHPEQDFMADGLTEEVLNVLAGVPRLRVTARTSSFFFKDKNLPVPEIAEILNVRHILEGSVRRSGAKVRITAQLIDARSDRHLWSETFDVEEADLFEVQDEVARAIVTTLTHSLDGLEPGAVSRAANVAAYEAYRAGRTLWWRRTNADLVEAQAYFEEAIEHDPGFAPAWAALADTAILMVVQGNLHLVEGERRAEESVEKALALDPDCAEAYAALGVSRLTAGRKTEAEALLRKAIELDASYIPAYLWLGILLGDQGRAIEQGRVLREAMAMDPLNEMLAFYYAENLQIRGDAQGAREALESLLRLQPDDLRLRVGLSEVLLETGQLADAWFHARRAYELDPENSTAIIAMGNAWKALEEFDAADAVWRAGLAVNPRSVDLKTSYLELLAAARRADDMRAVMDDLFPSDITTISAGYQRTYHWFAGLVSDIEGDYPAVREHFEQVVDGDERQHYDRDQVFVLTVISAISTGMGDPAAAEQALLAAERAIGHARINGVDSAEFYYGACIIFALRGDHVRALDSLQLAYARGFRLGWLLALDQRLDPLRDDPVFQQVEADIATDLEQARAEVEGLAGDPEARRS